MSDKIEFIPDADYLARLIIEPAMIRGNSWRDDVLFQFSSTLGRKESVIWRKYAKADEDVHCFGFNKEELDKEKKEDPEISYRGFLSAVALEVRSVCVRKVHGFEVVHAPDEGQHHAHIEFSSEPNCSTTKNDRSTLKVMLCNLFKKRTLTSPPSK